MMRTKKSFRLFMFSFFITTLCLVITPETVTAREAQLFGITQWTSTCPGGTRNAWDNMGNAWYNEITDTGFNFFGLCIGGHCGDAYTRDYRMVNGSMKGDYFTERALFSHGQDSNSNRIDSADAALIFTHGNDVADFWVGLMREKDGNNDCYINAQTELRIGDYDTEFLHLSSCKSLEDNQLGKAYQLFGHPSNQRRLHLLTGFHGCMWIGNSLISDYEDFADDAFDMSVGLAWMQNMYRTDIVDSAGVKHTQCPIAYSVGSDFSDCLNRLTTERYKNVKPDPSSVGAYCYYYYNDCDPACEDTFGNAWR